MLAERRFATRLVVAALLLVLAGCGGSSGPSHDLSAQDVQKAFAAEKLPLDVTIGKGGSVPRDALLQGPNGLVVLVYRSDACRKKGVNDPGYGGSGCPTGPALTKVWPHVRNVVVEADDTGAVRRALKRLDKMAG